MWFIFFPTYLDVLNESNVIDLGKDATVTLYVEYVVRAGISTQCIG